MQNVANRLNSDADGHKSYTFKITCNSVGTAKGNQIPMFKIWNESF